MSSDLGQKIFKQIEYYFGDINFSRDNFLKDQSGKENGWIPITTLLTFNRLKALTTNVSEVADVFANTKSEIVELNEAKDKLRRLKPLPEIDDDFKLNCKLRTVHLKGFPREDTTLDDLIEYCTQYGEIESVQMRRFKDDKKFKGCCFAVYKDVESANKAISSNDKFKGEHELTLRENKETYFTRKFHSKPKKENKPVDASAAANGEEGDENNESKVEKKSEEEDKNEFKYEIDTIIKIYDLPSTITFKDIKPKLSELASIQYVDIFPETQSAIIRFKTKTDRDIVLKTLAYDANKTNGNSETSNEKTSNDEVKSSNEADKVAEEVEPESTTEEKTNENKEVEDATKEDVQSVVNNDDETTNLKTDNMMLKIKDDLIVKYSLVEGEEEKEYWNKIKKVMQESNKRQKQFKKSRFGAFNKFNRKRSANGDRNSNKKAKTDA